MFGQDGYFNFSWQTLRWGKTECVEERSGQVTRQQPTHILTNARPRWKVYSLRKWLNLCCTCSHLHNFGGWLDLKSAGRGRRRWFSCGSHRCVKSETSPHHVQMAPTPAQHNSCLFKSSYRYGNKTDSETQRFFFFFVWLTYYNEELVVWASI